MVFTDYAEAKQAADEAAMSFVGFGGETAFTYDGYVLVAKDATPVECRNAAFEAMRGRPIDEREEVLLTLAEARSAQD